MHVGKKNPRHPYYTSSNGLKSVEVEKDLGIMVTSDLKCSQQCGVNMRTVKITELWG